MKRLIEIVLIACRLSRQFFQDSRIVGLQAASTIFYAEITTRRLLRFLAPRRTRALLRLSIKGYKHPLYFRHGTTDLSVIRQIFLGGGYECLKGLTDVGLIIDCGANIGCAAFYLLHIYPLATLIAVEPESSNCDLCRLNLKPFQDRILIHRSAVWDHETGLRVYESSYGGGGEWAFEVHPVSSEEQVDVRSKTISAMLDESEYQRIDILKIDIEGSERFLFGDNCHSWLTKTRNLAIELHGDECARAFFAALREYRFDLTHWGELTVCKEIRKGCSKNVLAPTRRMP